MNFLILPFFANRNAIKYNDMAFSNQIGLGCHGDSDN